VKIKSTAGTLFTDATVRCTAAPGAELPRILASSASTVLAMLAMPTVMVAKSPARLIALRYGRISRGASIMPMKKFVTAPVATGPSTPIVRSSAHAKVRSTRCRILGVDGVYRQLLQPEPQPDLTALITIESY
jgi:hypothetical protein